MFIKEIMANKIKSHGYVNKTDQTIAPVNVPFSKDENELLVNFTKAAVKNWNKNQT